MAIFNSGQGFSEDISPNVFGKPILPLDEFRPRPRLKLFFRMGESGDGDADDDASGAGDVGAGDAEGSEDSGESEGGEDGFGGFLDEEKEGKANPNRPFSSEDILQKGRELAISGVPFQVATLLAALSQLRARAHGSTATILPSISRQLNDLRTQFGDASQALSRRLGPAGGGQHERGRQRLLTDASSQFARLLSQSQQQGFAGLINVTGGIQPQFSGAARAPSVTTGASQFNPALQGEGIASLVSLAQQFQNNTEAPTGFKPEEGDFDF
jgi:hypothetical protein